MIWVILLVLLIGLLVAARSSPSAVAGLVNGLLDRVMGVIDYVREDVEDLGHEWRTARRDRAARPDRETAPTAAPDPSAAAQAGRQATGDPTEAGPAAEASACHPADAQPAAAGPMPPWRPPSNDGTPPWSGREDEETEDVAASSGSVAEPPAYRSVRL